MRVLITRPEAFAAPLGQLFQTLNVDFEYFPCIHILPYPNSIIQQGLKGLTNVDKIIVTSRSVPFYTPFVIENLGTRFPKAHWSAIGTGTGDELKKTGFLNNILVPLSPFNSEALLSLSFFQSVNNQDILILKGHLGLRTLEETLQKRGAHVHILETYRREIPVIDIAYYQERWRSQTIDVMITTSGEGLKNLHHLVLPILGKSFYDIPVIVVGLRMLQIATNLGFRKPIMAEGADREALFRAFLRIVRDKDP